jgi:galacturan 1,4-alpha-galacturonidase
MHLLEISLMLAIGSAFLTPVYAVPTTGNVCTVKARGHQQDDVENILQAFKKCDNGGTVVFPEDQSYWIATRLNPVLTDVTIEWRGKWTVSDLSPISSQIQSGVT